MGDLSELDPPLCGFGRAAPFPGRSYLAGNDGAPLRVEMRPDLSVYRAVADAIAKRTGVSYERALIDLLKGQPSDDLLSRANHHRSGVMRRIGELGNRTKGAISKGLFTRARAKGE
jgi:hypothetical protein